MMTARRCAASLAALVPLVLALAGCAPDPADARRAAGAGPMSLEIDGVEVGDDFYPETLEHLIAARPGVVAFATSPASDGHLRIDVVGAPPVADLPPYDHVAEASLTTTGTIAVAALFDHADSDAEMRPALDVPPGTYRVRAMFQGLDPVTLDGIDSPASYHLVLWPEEYRPPTVLKPFTRPGESEPAGAPGC
jgi:hypothetical protein